MRCPTRWKVISRVRASFTGRPATLAATAARTSCGRVVPFEPKPPPTCGECTSTCPAGAPNSFATVPATSDAFCVVVHSVSVDSSSHIAIEACGSIGTLCSGGVSYTASTEYAAAASADSTSPSEVSDGKPALSSFGVNSCGSSARNCESCGRPSTDTARR